MTRNDAINAYLSFFAARGFGVATLDAVSAHAGTSPAALMTAVGDRFAALDAFSKRCDLGAIEAAQPGGTVRDRLFDLTMARFDAAAPFRDAVIALEREGRRRPALALAALAMLPRTAAILLSAAGVNTLGLEGIARVNVFAAVLADAGRVWLTDDEPDQSATMRALDRRLDRIERTLARLERKGVEPLPPPPSETPPEGALLN